MKYYLLYRIYSKKESPLINGEKDIKYYGWTNYKSILKLFFKQRDRNKYDVYKYNKHEIESDKNLIDLTDRKYMVVPMQLQSVNAGGKKITLYTTYREERDAESNIKKRFNDLASLDIRGNINDADKLMRLVHVYCALKEKYLDALDSIGYFPKEVQILYDDINEINDEEEYCTGTFKHLESNMGNQLYHQVLYSLESFVKVLKDDM